MKILISLFLLFTTPLISLDTIWNFPVTNLPSSIITNTAPDIAYNIDQIGVAVWQDAAGGSVLHSAKLENELWQALPSLPTTGVIETPKVGIDDAGQAMILWQDTGTPLGVIHAARLNGTTWTAFSPFQGGPTAQFPHLAVSRGGDAVAIWHTSTPSSEAAIYDKGLDTWLPTSILSNQPIAGNNFSVSINSTGTAVVAFNNADGTIQASYYNGSWTTVPVAAGPASNPSVSINENGNALLTWLEENGINSAIYSGGGWTPILPSFGTQPDKPKVAFFDDGTGIVVWRETAASTIRGAHFNGATWTEYPTPISGASSSASDVTLVSNNSGRALAAWNDFTTNAVMAASFVTNAWNPEQILSDSNTDEIVGSMNSLSGTAMGWINLTPPLSLFDEGQGSNALTGYFGTLSTSPGQSNCGSPSNLIVCIKPNHFLTQSYFLFCLSWTASTDSDATCYRIYRNGKFLAEVSANQPLCFEDCTGCCKTLYQVSAVNSQGIESPRINPC